MEMIGILLKGWSFNRKQIITSYYIWEIQ